MNSLSYFFRHYDPSDREEDQVPLDTNQRTQSFNESDAVKSLRDRIPAKNCNTNIRQQSGYNATCVKQGQAQETESSARQGDGRAASSQLRACQTDREVPYQMVTKELLSGKECRNWYNQHLESYLLRRVLPSNEDQVDDDFEDNEEETAVSNQDEEFRQRDQLQKDDGSEGIEYSQDRLETQEQQPASYEPRLASNGRSRQDSPTANNLAQAKGVDVRATSSGRDPGTTRKRKIQSTRSSSRQPRKNHRSTSINIIPHLDEATNHVADISKVDLWSRTVTLELCRVVKFWPLRKLRRSAVQNRTTKLATPATTTTRITTPTIHPRPQPYYGCADADASMLLPRMAAAPGCQDDGPLWTAYKYVFSMELEQGPFLDWHNSHHLARQTDLQRRVAELHSQSTKLQPYSRDRPRRRIMVYFYDDWARSIQAAICNLNGTGKSTNAGNSKLHHQDEIVMSFFDLSGLSVFPYAPTDWYDADNLSSFCFVIGNDAERIRIGCGDDVSPLRIVGQDLTIHVARVRRIATQQSDTGRSHDMPFPVLASQRRCLLSPVHAIRLALESDKGKVVIHELSADESSSSAIGTYCVEVDTVHHEDNRSSDAQSKSHTAQSLAANATTTSLASTGECDSVPIFSTLPSVQGSRTGPAPRRNSQNLRYDPIIDFPRIMESHKSLSEVIPQHPCMVNFYGVVLNFTAPTLAKRGDWMMGVALIDDSVPLPTPEGHVESVQINIFVQFKDQLPKIQYAGDVFRCHRVRLETWNDHIQLLGVRGTSSYVVCRGKVNDPAATMDWTVLPTAKFDFTMTESDQKRFAELWHWAQKRLLSHPTVRASHRFQICDLPTVDDSVRTDSLGKPSINGDLICMVCAIIPYPQNELTNMKPRGYIRVWDGSGPPQCDPFPVPSHPGVAVNDGDPPSTALVKLATVVEKLQFVRNSPDLKPPTALCGRVVNLTVWETAAWTFVLECLKVGSFIRLRNVNDGIFQSSTPLLRLNLHSKSSLTPLPDLTYEVVVMLEAHNQRLLRNDQLNPQSGLLPLEDSRTFLESITNLRDRDHAQGSSATTSGHDVSLRCLLLDSDVSSFQGQIHLVDVIPPLQILSMDNNLQVICPSSASGEHEYLFGIRISDGIADLDAVVCENAVAESLLGFPASHAIHNPQEALMRIEQILQDRRKLHVELRSILLKENKSLWWIL